MFMGRLNDYLNKEDIVYICWAKKSFLSDVPAVERCNKDDLTELSKQAKIFKVSKTEFKKIAQTLHDFENEEILNHIAELEQIVKSREDFLKFGPFVITDGYRWLAINHEGFNYPRYKSRLPWDIVTKLENKLT